MTTATTTLPSITFYAIRSSTQKLLTTCRIAHDHFAQKTPLLIYVASKQVAEYIDTLLWQTPVESFLPHTIKGKGDDELIEIITELPDEGGIRSILNLTPDPLPLGASIYHVHELDDKTAADKAALSKNRYNYYKSRGCPIAEIGG